MAYMNKKLRHYVEVADATFRIPKSFQKFIDKHKIMENLILKHKDTYYCTYCKHEFISKVKIGNQVRCPHCKHKYTVRRFTLKRYKTKKNLILFDKVEDKFVLRVFELCSTYKQDMREFEYLCTEYRRVFFDDYDYNETVESDIVHHSMGSSYVYHYMKHTCWKKKEWGWYYNSSTVGYVEPLNIKKILNGTKYQYTQLWKVITRVNPFDLVYFFQHKLKYYYSTFELLTKLKLYNLALNCEKFNSTKKSFEERFRVSKNLLPFMQRNNITYKELEVLRYCKTPNIRLLRALSGGYNLEWLSHWIDFLTAWRKGLLSLQTEHEYKDYLKFAIQLEYDMKDKKILYPDNLEESHNKLQKLVEICRNEANTKLLQKRYEELKDTIYKTKKFMIYPVSSADELINESNQMSNCVKTYTERAAMGECDIYLMRLCSNPKHSLVTVEVRNNHVVQAKIKHNGDPTKEQMNFLNRWEQKALNKEVLTYA